MVKKTQKKDNTSDSVLQEIRRLGVLIEHVDGKVGILAEQFVNVQEKLDTHTEMIGAINTDVQVMKVILNNHTEKLDAHTEAIGGLIVDMQIVKDTLDKHTKILDEHTEILNKHTKILDKHSDMLSYNSEEIGGLTTDTQVVKEDVRSIKGSMKKKIDVEEFTALEQRVSVIEKRR